jgi:hypothetical protein
MKLARTPERMRKIKLRSHALRGAVRWGLAKIRGRGSNHQTKRAAKLARSQSQTSMPPHDFSRCLTTEIFPYEVSLRKTSYFRIEMIDSCKHHAHCDLLPTPRRRQTTLAIIDGFLALSLDSYPLSRQVRRTSAGKSVRNIANTPTFSTTDSSLTSFLRLPPEVRLQIYSYLLISHQTIQYGICPIKWRLVAREQSWQPWIRHGIFPSILECCRRINAEGSAVLYGRNTFEIEQYMRSSTCAIVGTWAPSRANMLSIARLGLNYGSCCDCSQDRRTLEIMDLFPALKEVKICLQDPKPEEWIKFLEVASGRLQRVKKFMLKINVGSDLSSQTKTCV